jgi:hypothetical protein
MALGRSGDLILVKVAGSLPKILDRPGACPLGVLLTRLAINWMGIAGIGPPAALTV